MLAGGETRFPVKAADEEGCAMAYAITEPCKGVNDASCVEVCPVSAIYFQDDVPTEWQRYIVLNESYFATKQE